MTKEELLALGLTEEQIKEVFKLNGIAVTNAKGELTTKETEIIALQGQLKVANKQINEFKDLDVDGIKAAADDYKIKFEAVEAKAKEELEALKFNHAIENALSGAKAKNVKAVKALLNIEGLKLNGDEVVGLKEQLELIKTENDYLFGGKEDNNQNPFFFVKKGGTDGEPTDPESIGAALARQKNEIIKATESNDIYFK